jgi:hypothetical protein
VGSQPARTPGRRPITAAPVRRGLTPSRTGRWAAELRGKRQGAPLCRWLIEDLVIDVMPALESVLGFTNRWYRQARKQSEERDLPGSVKIRVVTAPLFVATKIEAFRSRGRGDFVASHDLEDIIAVIDGRSALAEEVRRAPVQIRQFLASTVGRWLEDPDFIDAVRAASGAIRSRTIPAIRSQGPLCSTRCSRPPTRRGTARHDERRVLPVSSLLTDYRGMSDVCLSVPCIVDRGGVDCPLPIPVTADEEAGLRASATRLQEVLRSIGF